MEVGKYKTPEGEINIVEVNEEAKKVLIYRGDEPVWLNESDCEGWEKVELTPERAKEVYGSEAYVEAVEKFTTQPEPVAENEEPAGETISEEKLPRKRTQTKKPVASTKKTTNKK